MSEITFPMLMTNLWILCGGVLTIPWCGLLVDILDWHREPPTWQKAVILGVSLFLPLMLFFLTATFMYPEAFL